MILLTSTTLAKPHCGLITSRSNPTPEESAVCHCAEAGNDLELIGGVRFHSGLLARQRESERYAMSQTGHVAIIDDDATICKGLARLLSAYGIASRTYTSASDFLHALRSGMPDCLIVDMNMPSISGLDLMRELAHRGIQIPSIVMTGRPSEEIRDECRGLGATSFLVKPLDHDALMAAINSTCC